jgi:hypothetical protein
VCRTEPASIGAHVRSRRWLSDAIRVAWPEDCGQRGLDVRFEVARGLIEILLIKMDVVPLTVRAALERIQTTIDQRNEIFSAKPRGK